MNDIRVYSSSELALVMHEYSRIGIAWPEGTDDIEYDHYR